MTRALTFDGGPVSQVVHPGDDDRMTVSTIHGAKGTEAEIVYVLGCEERLLPSGYAIDEDDPLRIEEERRLMYIALTRAKTQATVTTAAERVGDQRPRHPSRFLSEAGLLVEVAVRATGRERREPRSTSRRTRTRSVSSRSGTRSPTRMSSRAPASRRRLSCDAAGVMSRS